MEQSSKDKLLRIKGSAQRVASWEHPVKSKGKLREELKEGERIFLANGGKIQKIAPGVSGVKDKKHKTLSNPNG